MVNSVSQAGNVPKTTRASIFYINDVHGQVANMERIKAASDSFDASVPTNSDKLKFSSGDTILGENLKLGSAATGFLDSIGINATAVGNHECDVAPEDLVKLTNNAKYKLLGLNVNIPTESPWSKKIAKSYIQEINGTKYGVIGLAPSDMFLRIKYKQKFEGITVDDTEQTIKEVQEEIDNLKKQNIDKIIIVSHVGYEADKKIAQETNGIDIILGAHSHDLLEGIQEGKNLFYSKKTGEPVIITQAGKDGNYFGVLNLEFNEKGVITKAQNNITETRKFPKNAPIKYFFDSLLGKSEKIGTISIESTKDFNRLIQENPNASFIADAVRNELKTDLAIINSSNLRNQFEVGDVYSRDVSSIVPFKNKVIIVKLNEKELVDAIKFGAKSLISPDNKPGILQFSGLKYKINKSGELLEAKFIDKDGKEVPIDINNPNTFKTYTVAGDDFILRGKDGFDMLNKYDNAIQKFDFDKDKCAIDYIKKINKPIEIKPDGRITIVNS